MSVSAALTATAEMADPLLLDGRSYQSRLLVGTGKYRNLQEATASIQASGAEIVTVAIRRLNPDAAEPGILDVLTPERYTILPNTAGCFDAEAAVHTCRLARELLDGHSLVKLEVMGEERYLFPDVQETMQAVRTLVREQFRIMVYTTDDPVMAQHFENEGCIAIMPLAAPIGSGLGIRNPDNIAMIVEQAGVPVLVDAGVGTASDAAVAMELGCDGVLMNTAIAGAADPVRMAGAMRLAIQAGREAYRAGRIPRRNTAAPSSPPL